ncbi:MAG: glycosyltransferase [Lewinella sp.]|nr:glycosyltransferase [Lewinella sp.]
MLTVPATIGLLVIVLATVYAGLLGYLWRAWRQLPAYSPAPPESEFPFLTVLVPARNEADLIEACLQSLLRQDYSNFEVIVIDDHSEDHTVARVRAFRDPRLRLLKLADYLPAGRPIVAYKKAALELGIRHARGDYLVMTDADCVAPATWLTHLTKPLADGAAWVSAPVRIAEARGWLGTLQALDVAGTMILTGASFQLGRPLLANGANLLIKRTLFEAVDGYTGNAHRASGDDVFLLQKVVKQYTREMAFVRNQEATVATSAVSGWGNFLRQRLRWATKSSDYRDPYLLGFQGLVFLLDAALLITPFLTPLAWLAWLIKAGADYGFLRRAARSFQLLIDWRWFPVLDILHTTYVVLIGLLAFLPVRIRWKGRSSR